MRSNCYVTLPQQWKGRRQKVNIIINTVIKPLSDVLIIDYHSLQHQQRNLFVKMSSMEK